MPYDYEYDDKGLAEELARKEEYSRTMQEAVNRMKRQSGTYPLIAPDGSQLNLSWQYLKQLEEAANGPPPVQMNEGEVRPKSPSWQDGQAENFGKLIPPTGSGLALPNIPEPVIRGPSEPSRYFEKNKKRHSENMILPHNLGLWRDFVGEDI